MSLNLRISKNILQIGEPKASKSKFMHTLLKTKNIFAIEQKVIVSRFVKNVAIFFGTPGIYTKIYVCIICNSKSSFQGNYSRIIHE